VVEVPRRHVLRRGGLAARVQQARRQRRHRRASAALGGAAGGEASEMLGLMGCKLDAVSFST
jgi:hypothetical protein